MGMKYQYDQPTIKPPKADDEDGDAKTILPFFPKKKPYQQYDQTFTAQHVHFYISEEIVEPNDYSDMIHKINIAGPNDTIFLHLNTPGGQLDTGVQIINAMGNSQAKIVTILEGMAYSLGTLIFLSGDDMIVNDNCMIMFHNFKGGLGGKGNELASQLEATIKWFTALAKKIYIPFMSDEEFERITKGEDLWMQSSEIRRRLDRATKLHQAAIEEKARVKATPKTKKPRKTKKTKVDEPTK